MRRVETLSRQNTLEMGQSLKSPIDVVIANSERAVRANITEISGLRSGKVIFSRIEAGIQENPRRPSLITERKRGGGGRCRRKGVHEHGACGSPNCHVPKSSFKSNTIAERTNQPRTSLWKRTPSQKAA